ncbi:FAD-binding monooxygenase, partial [Clavibacter phaseoli]
VAAFGLAVRAAATPVASRIGRRFMEPPADRIDLPEYAHLER